VIDALLRARPGVIAALEEPHEDGDQSDHSQDGPDHQLVTSPFHSPVFVLVLASRTLGPAGSHLASRGPAPHPGVRSLAIGAAAVANPQAREDEMDPRSRTARG
jgi:hypothetical protein